MTSGKLQVDRLSIGYTIALIVWPPISLPIFSYEKSHCKIFNFKITTVKSRSMNLSKGRNLTRRSCASSSVTQARPLARLSLNSWRPLTEKKHHETIINRKQISKIRNSQDFKRNFS